MAIGKDGRTIVGVFEEYGTAERAARQLEEAGIRRSAIEVRSNFRTGAAGRGYESEHEGGISGFFKRLFGSEESDAEHYDEAVRRGNAVVSVTASGEQADRAVEILNSAGAVDIDRHVERYRRTGYERYDPNAPAYSYDEAAAERERFRGDEGGSVPVIEEQLQVGKRVVRRGGVRVYSHVVEEPVEENIELREERVTVDRRAVDRPAERREVSGLRDQTIEFQEVAEEPVVQKRARVREEVVVGKEKKTRTEKVRDTVRRTKVEVERMGDEDYRSDFRRDWESRYRSSGEPYETYEPAYEYGYRSASDEQWRGRSWPEAESELRSDWERRHPDSAWERFKDSVRYGWEKVTGRR